MRKKTSYLFLDNHSLLVINSKGKLRTLYTPFRVKCIEGKDNIPADGWVIVEEIESPKKHGLIYLIQNKKYSHKHFRIEIRF